MSKVVERLAFPDWLAEKTVDGYYTPDGVEIASQSTHLLFVYGTLRYGHFRNEVLTREPKNRLVKYGATETDNLGLLYSFKNKFPAAFLLKEDSKHKGSIFGEVWEVTDQTIRELDRLESNRYLFSRVKINVRVAETGGIAVIPNVWVYLGMPNNLHPETGWYSIQPNESAIFGTYRSYLKTIKLESLEGTHVVP